MTEPSPPDRSSDGGANKTDPEPKSAGTTEPDADAASHPSIPLAEGFVAAGDLAAGLEAARVRQALLARLFDAEVAPTQIGRFEVRGRLGAGAMGVVYSAYDAALGRMAAIKVLHDSNSDHEESRQRLVREAQAMARVRHPNLVAVHEVGIHEDQVFVAMQYVEGTTLTEWLVEHRPSWQEVVDLLTPAARGLAAIHEQGLVHRDFKPDNVLVDARGQVFVADFGLAGPVKQTTARRGAASEPDTLLHETLTTVGAVMGTPAYMAPEQWEGAPSDARSDQFSFCTVLFEALYGRRPFTGKTLVALAEATAEGAIEEPSGAQRIPPWLRSVVRRGLAPRAADRFEGMAALLTALTAGETQRRRRRWGMAAAVAVAAVAGTVGYQHMDKAQREAACVAEGDAIDEVWNDEARAGVTEGLVATQVPYAAAAADNVMPWIDKQADAWRATAAEACVSATVTHRWDAPRFDKARWCLEDRRLQLSARIEQLTHANAKTVNNAVNLVAGLARIESCVEEISLAGLPEPPAPEVREAAGEVRRERARAMALMASGDYKAGLEAAQALRERAEALGSSYLIAAAYMTEARGLARTGAHEAAKVAAVASLSHAVRSGGWDIAASATTLLTVVTGHLLSDPAEGMLWAEVAGAAIARAGDPLGTREAHRLNELGGLLVMLGKFGEAKEAHQTALELRTAALGPEHLDVGVSHNGLGVAYKGAGDFVAAKEHLERALAISTAALGANHPQVVAMTVNLGGLHRVMGEPERAKTLLLGALSISEATFGPEHQRVGQVLNTLASTYLLTDQAEEAEAAYARALGVMLKALPPDHPNVGLSTAGRASAQAKLGRFEEARSGYQRAVKIFEGRFGGDHPNVAQGLDELAEVHVALGDYREALVAYERVRTIAAADKANPTELARSEFALARTLWNAPADAGGDRARARTLSEQALAGYTAAGTDKAKAAERVQAWLSEHAAP